MRWLTACVIVAGATALLRQATDQSSFDEVIRTIHTGNAYQRAEAIGPLSAIDDPRVVPMLVALLGDEDAMVRTYAAQQLARLADGRSANALAVALSDSARNVRRYAAEGLTKIGNERHVPALVASVVGHLPDPNTTDWASWPCLPALEAIGRLSPKAPGELIGLLERISTPAYSMSEDWWKLLAGVAACLGQTRDPAAYEPLRRAQAALETGHQDYRTWYAVRKALAAIDPQGMAFDRPAADILDTVRPFKGNNEQTRRQWVLPLAQLGDEPVGDLQRVLRFESDWDRERLLVAIESLGAIGGSRAAGVLRGYIEKQSRLSQEDRQLRRPLLRGALPALLRAEPNEATIEDVLVGCRSLDSYEEERLVYDVSRASSEEIPREVKTGFYRAVLLGKARPEPFGGSGVHVAGRLLGQLGGEQAGRILSTALLNPPNVWAAEAAAQALGTIQDYDAAPALIEALTQGKAQPGTLAQALGTIGDRRAVTVLREAARREDLTAPDRLWIAAALARLGEDYLANARLIREALPDSLEQAVWLHDDESIRAVAALAGARPPLRDHAIHTLEAMNTDKAFRALVSLIDLETVTDPLHIETLANAAARMAGTLEHPSKEYWAAVAKTVVAVRGWFEIRQMAQPKPEHRSAFKAVKQHPALARKVWIAEANRRLDLAAAQAESWEYNIPATAVSAIELLYAPELAPTLERLVRESESAVDFHGRRSIVRHYHVRSLAARILTEKTGKPHTFIDVDGRKRPGGWDPSQEDSQLYGVTRAYNQ